MNLISDVFLTAGAFGAAIYCYVLSARLKKLTALETGMGGAIAVLSVQVDDMTKALHKAGGGGHGFCCKLGWSGNKGRGCRRSNRIAVGRHV